MSNQHYRVGLARSRLAAAFILAAGAATAALGLALHFAVGIEALLVAWTGAATLDAYRLVALRAGRGVRHILLRGAQIVVTDARGRQHSGALRPGSFVAPWLTILRWRPHGARFDRTVLILPDMLGAESFRELRVLLKWGQIPFPT
jgi:hypothetical protein